MKLPDDSRLICSALDQFCLPAALIERRGDRFAGWNKSFSEILGLSPDELGLIPVAEVLRAEAQKPETTECENSPTPVHPGQCVLKNVTNGETISAKVFEREDGHALLLVESELSGQTSDEFLRGLLIGTVEEKDRMRQKFHDDVAPRLMAAAFAAEALAGRAEEGEPQNPQELRNMADLISNLVAGVRATLESRNSSA